MSLMGLSCVRESYEFSESYESYMSSNCVRVLWIWCESYICESYVSLGCVWVFVHRHFHLPCWVLCIYIYICINVRLTICCARALAFCSLATHSFRLCCVGRKLRAIYFLLCGPPGLFLDSTPQKSCDVSKHFSWVLEVFAHMQVFKCFLSLRM